MCLHFSNVLFAFFCRCMQVPDLCILRLNEIAAWTRFVLISEVPDNASANFKKLAYSAKQLGLRVFMAFAGCGAHRVHRIIANTIDEDELVGNVYAVQLVCRIPSHYARIVRVLRAMVDDELVVIRGPPDPRWVQHTKAVFRHTMLRSRDFVRGRLDHGVSPLPSADDATLQARADMVCSILNYDCRLKRVGHCETGCCANRAEMVDKVATAILEAGLLMGHSNGPTSKNRWGSTLRVLGEECAGMMFHGILPRALRAAFVRWQDGDPGQNLQGDQDDEYRRMVQKKVFDCSPMLTIKKSPVGALA